jgi:hypothetical protein
VRPAPAHRCRTNAIIKTIEKESLQGLAEQKLDNGEVTSRNRMKLDDVKWFRI